MPHDVPNDSSPDSPRGGSVRPQHWDVIVIGGGLAGLAAATIAARRGSRTLLLEAHRVGGRAATDDRRGFRFNHGAHAVYTGGAGSLVMRRLGVSVRGHKPAPADLHGLVGDEVAPMPASPSGLMRSPLASASGKAQVARFLGRQLHRVDPIPLADRTASQWITDLSLRPDAAAIVTAFTRVATFCSSLDAISADAAVRQLQLSVRPGVSYLDGGWQTRVDGVLGAALAAGVEVRNHERVSRVVPDGKGCEVCCGSNGFTRTHRADAVVIAGLAPPAAADLLPEPPVWGGIGEPATTACLDLGVRTIPSKRVVFGIDRPLYLSTHCPPADLAPPGHGVVHLMRYGATNADRDRTELVALAGLVGLGADAIVEQRFLARMTVTHGTPVPGAGLAGRPTVDATGTPGVYIAGDWVGPVGLLSDATLASAEAAATAAARHAARVSV